ncbi:MAG: phosphate acyltransferase PlsX [Phycisphaerales bacterium]|jgi:glycerol-3-phosphate acyltransferase PlsX|nr:phosphate acyltransferase PlsX [Planctomycetaceae bacterium]MDP6157441.1 phosphate acyltransferase PlsX [Phycisphaerales bacterium]MDP6311447.1 phosphate acyltransferase PlsX [Phycisphaerales bacterium]MDP7087276.1 phosphate acyltransferase PlsX [Phycisphaerales bacterium]MDP7188946.1 phosphate acyltransferase PlsX [Phycisphaerales bacterium]|tara:strand:- start:2517 stop:3533 length:1017 start_codon:yes stop_codon:yes gene_type:complete
MRLGVDVMGGDLAPAPILEGALAATVSFDPDDTLVLFGDEAIIEAGVASSGVDAALIEVIPTSNEIEMNESPVEAARSKPDSALVQMTRMAGPKAGDARLDMAISAGNTGAFVAAAQMHMRRLPGVARPGIAAVVPTFAGPVTFIDVGANIDPKPHHLHQYGVMGTVYARRVLGIEQPRVGLMNVGSEEQKGTEDMQRARDLLRDDPAVEFVGYVEGRGVFAGDCDVVISDGVTGNVTIKLAEGLSKGIFKLLQQELESHDPAFVSQFAPIVKKLYAEYDYHEYGGAPLMGVNGGCLICHGSSKARTITNALAAARRFVELGVNARIIEILESQQVEA